MSNEQRTPLVELVVPADPEGSGSMVAATVHYSIPEILKRLNNYDTLLKQREALSAEVSALEDHLKKVCDEAKNFQWVRARLVGALEKIKAVDLRPELGQIVSSEHYEAAWLDCADIARDALASIKASDDRECGDCGDDGEEPSRNCPTCEGTGFKKPASIKAHEEGGEK